MRSNGIPNDFHVFGFVFFRKFFKKSKKSKKIENLATKSSAAEEKLNLETFVRFGSVRRSGFGRRRSGRIVLA